MVEIMMSLGVLALLMSVAVTQYGAMQQEALHKAALAELDAIKNDIQRYQLERRCDYPARTPPPGENLQDRRDPWFAPFHVDPARHLIYSCGPDGHDDQGQGDDVATSYDAYAFAELHPALGFRVADHGSDWVELTWQPVRYQPGIQGYNVYRRESAGASDFTTVPLNPALIPDSSEPKYRDEGVQPAKVYYYALEVIARDNTRATSPSPVGFQIPQAAPPRLTVTPSNLTISAGQTAQFTIIASAYGSPLRQLKFDGQTFDVDAGEKTLVLSHTFTTAGPQRLTAEAYDADNRRSAVDVAIEVK